MRGFCRVKGGRKICGGQSAQTKTFRDNLPKHLFSIIVNPWYPQNSWRYPVYLNLLISNIPILKRFNKWKYWHNTSGEKSM
jgi:hypothetical protein